MNEAPPVPMPLGDIISVREALVIAGGVSDETIYRWCRRYGIGRKAWSGPYQQWQWQVSLPGLRMVVAGDFDALEAFRAGDRTSEIVTPHMHRSKAA